MAVNRHHWVKIKRDYRYSVLDERPRLDRCAKCGITRQFFYSSWVHGHPKTYYEQQGRITSKRPECTSDA